MVTKYGKDFPDLSTYLDEWKGYKADWVKHLSTSRDVASKHVALLKRFDEVFLNMVESIATVQDRKDVIAELQEFIDEKHDDSLEMSQNFLNLKRDIQAFVSRFEEWIKDKEIELAAQAKKLKDEITTLQGEIEVLDKKIKDATTALAACAGLLNVVGMIVAGSVLAAFQAERQGKVTKLIGKQNDLIDVNRKQAALAHLKTDFDGLKPDIALICDKLVLFAEIWSSVRSQAVQFQEHLKGGSSAGSNMRFKLEVRLARKVCQPLMAGLERYATELENREKAKE
ncbi:hypothetical protein SERLA73DRAFT_187819 [Serpula lacrymans var. lacrymans S7.3]|uniref:Uncharacterized protein n=2 Tax=Serpula lacrymans var. lacrymans TaxID=341189 RepID=F8QAH3_SERL3|nr:uncharacterized protein SERLADRAFT_477629 [Serpula lacrymans var. lacrymans S7.9]EGN94763.1 hypothetical protein SERLA73DRAFT_187819 [Serpula lacrymans var. lacrymans S7.3]EGO20240.1 hypothetical protein SERLADRAFT_477629 [Serpula lacrymans var. lacrymans S7.9]